MKKIYLLLALVFSMSLDMFAQRNDGFFTTDNSNIYNRLTDDPNTFLNLPSDPLGSTTNEPAPLGDGLVILAVFGAGYAIRKRKQTIS